MFSIDWQYCIIIAAAAVAISELSPAMDWRKPFSCATCMAFWLSLMASIIQPNNLLNTGICMIIAALMRKALNWPQSF